MESSSLTTVASWLADQWRFAPREHATEFYCAPGHPGVDSLRTFEAGFSLPAQTSWNPYLAGSAISTFIIEPSMTPSSHAVVFFAPTAGARRYPPHSFAGIARSWPAAATLAEGRHEETNPIKVMPQTSQSSAPSPLQIILDLKGSLGLTWDDAEKATGIARNTFLYWQRTGATPRPSTVRKLMRLYGLIVALRSSLGDDEASAWLEGGEPSWIDVLKSGELKSFGSAVAAVLDADAGRSPRYFAYRPGPEDEDDAPTPPRRSFHPSDRLPRRSRLPRRDD